MAHGEPSPLLQKLLSGDVLIADGAAGTLLMAAGLPAGTPPETWNLDRPEAIRDMHRAYLDAGSQIILTNTFGANRVKLGRSGLADQVRALNRAGAEIALEAARGRAFVAGDMGPTGELMAPFGPLQFDQAVEAYAEQAAFLASAGVDALWVETLTDLQEARAAITGARQAADLPVLCSLSFGRKGRTMMGVSPKQAAETLWPLGLAAIGANCGEGLEMIPGVLEQFGQALPGAPLIAKVNAGLPRLEGEQTVYDIGPEQFAAQAAGFVDLGARLIGACCGSNPEFIAAIARLLQR